MEITCNYPSLHHLIVGSKPLSTTSPYLYCIHLHTYAFAYYSNVLSSLLDSLLIHHIIPDNLRTSNQVISIPSPPLKISLLLSITQYMHTLNSPEGAWFTLILYQHQFYTTYSHSPLLLRKLSYWRSYS